MSNKIVCIGGLNDGKVIETELAAMPEFRFPIYKDLENYLFENPENTYLDYTLPIEKYYLETFNVNKTKYNFYRHESLTIEQMFQRLIDGYWQK
jgi:hypothetical protein